MKKNHTYGKQKGAALMLVVIFMMSVTFLITEGFISPIVREYGNILKTVKSSTAYFLAEAGVEDAYYRLKNDMDLSSIEYLELDGATTTVTITTPSPGERQIVSSADVDSYFRKVQISVSSSLTDIEFGYAAQIGKGGIEMGQNAEVRGYEGGDANVHANGPFIGSSGSKVRGSVSISSDVYLDPLASSTACDVDQDVAHNPYVDVAQSFVAADTEVLGKVSLQLKRVGQPQNRTVRIVGDNAGSPGVSTLASETLTKNMGGTTYGWVSITFNSPASLVAGQTYWIMIDGSNHNSKYWRWCNDSSGGYGSGVSKYSSNYTSGSWTGLSGDLAFRVYLGEDSSRINGVEVTQTARADTISNSFIWGDAYYKDVSGTTVIGDSYADSNTPDSVPMPITDTMLSDWIADAESGGTVSGDCPGSTGCSYSMGPIKIDGDLILDNNDTFTIKGIVYVTGDVLLDNNSTFRCDGTFGANSCVILTEGTVEPTNNAVLSGSGTSGSYVVVVSTVEGCDGGAQQGHCLTDNSSIHISNNVTGGLFYSTSGMIYLDNNADIVSAVGYRLKIDNNGYITYEEDASETSVSSGSDSGWQMIEWAETE